MSGAGNLLSAGSTDPHYTLIASADPGSPGPAARVVNEGFPIGPWMANGPTSKWIAPMASQSTGSAAGNYTYRLSFDLGGLQPGTASITGQWSSDNAGTSVLLNGVPTGDANSGNFGAFVPFSISGGFVSGINTLDFVVNNAGDTANPTGLRVELSGTAEIEPPPGTPPSIQSDPDDITVLIGGSATFRVAATGASPLTYQWRRNSVNLPGAESATLNLAAVAPGDVGAYSVVVTNPWGAATSSSAQLEISLDLPTEEELEREPLGPSRRRSGLAFSEIMYHPRARNDGRVLEYIELYNSNPWREPLAGYRIDGSIDFTFPPGSEIAANGFLLVAANPADVVAEYGSAGVLGPWAGSLPDSGGSLRLIKRSGGVVLELEYQDDPPWPVAADGAGHSLALARASYGEADPRAWSKSASIGGSPGGAEISSNSALDHVLVNEIRANPVGADTDFVELHNRSFAAIDVSGCTLSDDPSVDSFVIPVGTMIAAGGFAHFTSTQLGFNLSTSGETVYFKNPAGTRVIDSLRFEAQAPGSTFGRSPDGHPSRLGNLAAATPGTSNSQPATHPVIINEIMFNPLHEDASEFIELHNRGTQAVDLGGWAFRRGIDYSFPPGATIAPGGFAIVAEDRAQLLADHPGLDGAVVFGDFGGSLSNRGEPVALSRPIALAGGGIAFTTVDALSYSDATQRVDGGGSSLELIDPDADNRAIANWAASDESDKAPWTTIEHSGVLELGKGTANQLQLFLLDAGEAQIDDVEVIPEGGSNRIPNSDFANASGWFFQGTHEPSQISGGVLQLRATNRGDLGSNRIRAPLSAALASGSRATIRARTRWQSGSPDLLLRLLGNYLEVPAVLEVPRNLGSPGAANSQLVGNAPPIIESVLHRPVLPGANEAVRITARASDPDGLDSITLTYRIDPSAISRQLAMLDDGTAGDLVAGDGIYTGVIPGQAGGTLVAFQIGATDRSGAAAQFPAGGATEGLVRWGDGAYAGGFATYRMWMSEETREIWSGREKMSNQPLGITFVYADQRVVYDAGAHFSGSAYTSPGYDSPTGRICGYDLTFPGDSMILGDDRLILDFPVRDPTAQREQLMYWFCDQSGLPNNYRRYVNVFVNGIGQRQRSGWGSNSNAIYTDIQQPNADSVREWFPDGAGGHLIKGSYWHEFDDGGARINPATPPTNEIFNGEDGGKHLARYRWNWRLRAVQGSPNDYSDFFARVDALGQSGAAFAPAVSANIDIEQWMRTLVVNDLASNWDSFGNPGGKNTFHYRPPGGRWQLMSWDFDVGLGVFNDPIDSALFSVSDPTIQRIYSTPELMRHYWHAMRTAVDSFFQPSSVAPVLDSKWEALVAAGVPVTSPNVPSGSSDLSIPEWISQRRQFLLQQLASVDASFAITTNGGNDFSTAESLVELEGTAPLTVATFELQGEPVQVEWTGVNSWRLAIPLAPGSHLLTVGGLDRSGLPLAGASDTIRVTVSGGGDAAAGNLVINEIMYHPAIPDTEYLEIHNRSGTTAFDLSGWRLNGIGFTFQPGSYIAPGGFLLLVENRQAFGAEYGWEIPVADAFPSSLDNGGEALTLLQPGDQPDEFIEIDRVRYAPDLPWPGSADGLGPALQLVDPSRDNSRPSNWSAAIPDAGEPGALVPMTATWSYNQNGFVPTGWNEVGFDDAAWPSGEALFFVEGASLPAPKNTPLSLGPITYYFRTNFDYPGPAGGGSLAISTIIDDGAVIYLNGSELMRQRLPDGQVTANTLASPFVDNAELEGPFIVSAPTLQTGENVLAVEVHQSVSNSSDIVMGIELLEAGSAGIVATPGAPNVVPAGSHPEVLQISLNEIRPTNLDGASDNFGEPEPWIELFNTSSASTTLDGWFLSDDPAQLTKWPFPTGSELGGGEFQLVWLDGETGETTGNDWHANFEPSATSGSILLSYRPAGAPVLLVDALNYSVPLSGKSLGRFPDGSPIPPSTFAIPTPGAPNDNSIPLPPVTINEWMAANEGAIADPADGDFDDWFELYNSGSETIDLSGFTLTDDLSKPTKFTIPAGTVIAGNGYLLVWADEEPGQGLPSGDLHANFSLRAAGEAIGLFAANGALIDAVEFGEQASDTSEGRWPDGGSGEEFFPQRSPTPGTMNDLAPPSDPLIPELTIAWNVSGDGLVLTFSTEFGRYYIVQKSADMRPRTWQDVSTELPGKGTPIEFEITRPDGERASFYRIAILASP